mmetsp:Transcript_57071/g.121269  ORF Transcript_57071/g.121269 Transcript_57071/m.121269 type:complete len:249 (-) Transcript_57071:27-773(-)
MALRNRRLVRELSSLKTKTLEQDGVAIEITEAMESKLGGSGGSSSSSSVEGRVDLIALIAGPKDSPYEGGVFRLSVSVPMAYPMDPPKMQFQTRIYHPNVGQGHTPGAICLDILRKEAWSPSLTIERTLISIASLLADPNPESPMDGEAANLYKKNRKAYDREVQKWVQKYASGKNAGGNEGSDAWQGHFGKADEDAAEGAPLRKKRKTSPAPPPGGARHHQNPNEFGPPTMNPEWARPVVIDLDLED